jgi:hypothetical protein
MNTWLGLTTMRQEAEVRRFSEYLVRLDHHEAGSRAEEVSGYLVGFDRHEAGSRGEEV